MSDASLAPLTDQTAGVTRRLALLRRDLTMWIWMRGLAWVLWCGLILLALDLVLDWFFRMDRPQRGVMLGLMLGSVAYVAYRTLLRPLAAAATDDALCLQVEAQNQQLGQSLISALQLARIEDAAERGMSPLLVAQTVRQGTAAAADIEFSRVLNASQLRRSTALTALALGAILALGWGAAHHELLATGLNRNLLLGDRTWPQQTYLEVRQVVDGKVVLPRGEDWTQLIAVTPESQVVPSALYIDFHGASGRSSQLLKRVPGREREFSTVFSRVIEPFEFRARGGDALTPWIRIELVEQPALETLALKVIPPAYTQEPSHLLPAGKGPYYVLQGSRLQISGVANKPLARAALLVEQSSFPLAVKEEVKFNGELAAPSVRAGQYTFDLEDTLGLVSRRPATFGLRIRPDREPRVRARLVGVSGIAVPQARVPLSCRINDDFGITSLQAVYQWRGDDAERAAGQGTFPLAEIRDQLGQREISFDAALELGPLKIPAGTGLSFHVAASDNDDVSGPNMGKSSEFLLRIVTEEELRTDLLRREKEQRQEFERLLKNQEDLLTDTRALEAAVAGSAVLATEQKDQLMQFQRRQKQIGANVAAIAERMLGFILEIQNNRLEADGGRFQSRLRNEIARPLGEVAEQGVPLAMQKLDQSRRLASEPQERDAALAAAVQTETDIVGRMQQILTHMTDAEGYQEAVNLLYEIQKMQQDVLDRTLKAKQERIQGILEGSRAP